MNGTTQFDLHQLIKSKNYNKTILAAFSLSWPPFLNRLHQLVEQSAKMKKNNIGLILIQIEEAHTKKWPLGFTDHPDNHNIFENRVSRANDFAKRFNQFENVYIDGWDNNFE